MTWYLIQALFLTLTKIDTFRCFWWFHDIYRFYLLLSRQEYYGKQYSFPQKGVQLPSWHVQPFVPACRYMVVAASQGVQQQSWMAWLQWKSTRRSAVVTTTQTSGALAISLLCKHQESVFKEVGTIEFPPFLTSHALFVFFFRPIGILIAPRN